MHWTATITVALLNVTWIFFFLQADPFSVFVQRRSSDEETLYGEFCLHLQSETNPTSTPHSVSDTSKKTNDTNTTAEALKNNLLLNASKETSSPQNCQCKNTKMIQKDSKLVAVDLRPLAPGCAHKLILTYINMEVCMDPDALIGLPATDLDEKTSASADALGATSSDVSTDAGMSESSTSAASLFTTTHRSAAPVTPKYNQNGRPFGPEMCCFKSIQKQIRLHAILSYRVTDRFCPKPAILVRIKNGKEFCVDPESEWWRREINLDLIKEGVEPDPLWRM